MSSIFSMENLLIENVNDTTSISNTALDANKSYRSLALSHIIEMNEELNNANKFLYRSILESNSDIEIVNEGFSEFFDKVKEVIEKFLKWIKSLFERFVAQLHKFVGAEKYLIKKKDKFRKFSSKHEFDIEGYNYTFVPSVPEIEALAAFNEEFIGIKLSDYNDKTGIDSKLTEDLADKYSNFIDELDNGDLLNRFRAECLGRKDEEISEEDFADELFMEYRDGESIESTITVNNTIVMEALNHIETYKKLEENVKKTKNKIEKDYEKIKKNIENMISRSKDRDASKAIPIDIKDTYTPDQGKLVVSAETLNKLDLFMKAKSRQVVEMSSIHSMAFSYKLDAITDRTKQDKKILYTALSKLNKDLALESMIEKYTEETNYSFIEESTSEALVNKICNMVGVDVRDSSAEAKIKVQEFVKKSPITLVRKAIGNIIILIGMVAGGLVIGTGLLALILSFLPILIGGTVIAISISAGSAIKGESTVKGLENDLKRALAKVEKMPDSKEKKMMKRSLESSLSELKVKKESVEFNNDSLAMLENYSEDDMTMNLIDMHTDSYLSKVNMI